MSDPISNVDRSPSPPARVRRTLDRACRRWKESLHELWLGLSARVNPARGVQPLWTDGIIVSLTTTERRLPMAHVTVETLLRQTLKPQRIILWLSETASGIKLPLALTRQLRRGLEIRFCRDLGCYTKLIHALREYPDRIIVTADDDMVYPRWWLEALYASYQKWPRLVHCHRAHRILADASGGLKPYFQWDWLSPGQTGPSHWLLPTGVGGVLYPPGALHPEVFNEAAFLRLSPTDDDFWFKAVALLQGTACVKVSPCFREFPAVHGTQHLGLFRQNRAEGILDRQIRGLFAEYNLMALLQREPDPAAAPGLARGD